MPSWRSLARLFAAVVLMMAVNTAHSGPAQAGAGERISEIRVTGAARISEDTILSQLELKRGEIFDAARSDRSIHALFATGHYKDVRIDRKGSVVTVKAVENPVVASVTFSGNSDIKADKLQAAIKLKNGAVYSQAKAHADAILLRDFYRNEGRLTTAIEPKATAKDGNKVDLAFVIQEGKVDRVSSITFEGNQAFSAAQLEDVVATVKSSWLDIIKSNSIYVAARLEEDRALLRRHYLTHGYADAKVLSADATLETGGKGYAVKYVIEEGDSFNFGLVKVESALQGIATSSLTAHVLVKPGEVYNAELIDKTTEAMSLALWESGQRFARVMPKRDRDAKARLIAITYLIEDGPHVTVERVDVSGNKKTQDAVIRREMKIVEGEPFNALVLERDKARIKALGFFKSVEMKTKPGASADKLIVTVDVVEDETLVLSVGGGYSTTEGIIGDIAIEERNLFGSGRSVKLKLAGSLLKLQAELGYTEPHLLGTNVVGGFDLFYKDFDASVQSSYKSQKIGGDLRAAYAISDTWSGSVNYSFVQNTIYGVGAAASPAIKEAVPGYPNTTSNTYYTSSIGYALAYDTRNSKKLPTSGTFFTLSQDLAGVGGDVRYIKSTADLRSYYALTKDVTLAGRTTAGNIMGWGGQDVRLLDMYYLGGESSVRGFASGGIGPRDTQSANLDALGGKNYITTTAEARFGLPLIPDDIGLRGVVFADAGSLFGTSASAAKLPGLSGTTASLRSSVGAGLIWDSPIGPLRADYAFPLSKQPFDKVQPWSFGLAAF